MTHFAKGALAALALTLLGGTASAETIRLGYVTPKTGPLAPFATADDWIIEHYRKIAEEKGLDFEVIVKDSQSNPDRAAEVAKELILEDEVHMLLSHGTPETTNPVSTTCENEEVPCVSSDTPWQPWFIGQQANPGDPESWEPFEYSYHFFWGLEDVIENFTNMWGQLETNKQVAGMFPNDADGNAWGDANVGFPPALESQGYTLADPGRYQNLTDDFSAQINTFKEMDGGSGADILTGVMIPPDFTTFWNQAKQQGYTPKAASIGKALLFPEAVNVLGENGHNLSTEVWWSPNHPFTSSLSGQSAGELAQEYMDATGKPWTQPIGFAHALFEVATDVFARVDDPSDTDAVIEAIRATDLDTIVGNVSWNGAKLPPFAAQNVAKTPLVGGQWRLQDDGTYDLVIVDNTAAPEIPTGGTMEPIE